MNLEHILHIVIVFFPLFHLNNTGWVHSKFCIFKNANIILIEYNKTIYKIKTRKSFYIKAKQFLYSKKTIQMISLILRTSEITRNEIELIQLFHRSHIEIGEYYKT